MISNHLSPGVHHHWRKSWTNCLHPHITLTQTQGLSFEFHSHQFPVGLAFGMTINKSQGQSLSTVGLDLRYPVFSHGQFYVAVSRGTTWHRIKVLLEGNVTNNIVFPDVLLD